MGSPTGVDNMRECLLCEHTVPLNKSWIKILGLNALAQPEADEVKHLLHPGVALD